MYLLYASLNIYNILILFLNASIRLTSLHPAFIRQIGN